MPKLKLKATYGGYKEIAQYGVGEAANMKYYQDLANGAIQQKEQQESEEPGFVGKITGAINTGFEAYQSFIGGKRKLANQINNGIMMASGVANMFNNAQLKRREDEMRIQSLQSASYDNTNRGTNNIPIYTQYGGSSKTNVEAEKGEVFENNGDVLRIDESAPTHEQGGVEITADRVLENTSSMRKDTLSKALKLPKELVTEMSEHKAKKSMSHSEAYAFEAKKNSDLEAKYMKEIGATTSDKKADKLKVQSAKLNLDLGLAKLPSENEIFDKYFEHQEAVKEDMGFYNNKLEAKYGKQMAIGGENPYRKGKQKTPTGKSSNFSGTDEDWKQYVDTWSTNLGKTYDANTYGGVYDLQYDAYNWALDNNPQAIRDMWKTYGLNEKAKQNGITYDTNNLNDDQLKDLRTQYVDGLSGVRMLQPNFDNERIDPIAPLTPRQGTLGQQNSIPTRTIPINPQTSPSSVSPTIQNPSSDEFNQPLEWYDTIGPAAALLAGTKRDPELFNPVNISQLRLQQQDVRPALNNSQAEYNAATANLGNDSIGAAQRAQIFSNKLRADNQVIGQYENANKQIQNQETQYNTNARDRQEAANATSRENFYTKVLQGRANQQEQLLTGIDAMAKTFAENRAFNRNANLIKKLAPNFDEKGNFNGKAATITSNSSQPGVATSSNGQPIVNEKGQYLLRSRTKDGKVTEEYVSKDYYDRITNSASNSAITNKLIMQSISKPRK